MLKMVYCPYCLREYGRRKLLFKYESGAEGAVEIVCRGCRNKIVINFDKEPESR